MISNIVIPDLGATGGDVTVVEWLVQTGDSVETGQPLVLVETDKATVELESFRDGVVLQLLVEEGDSVSLGSTVALVADSMEEKAPVEQEASHPDQIDREEPQTSPGELTGLTEEVEGGRVLVSPIARRMAEAEGIDLSLVQGSGRQGQILKQDVEMVLASARARPDKEAGVRREKASSMRQAIARRTTQSKRDIPHYYAEIIVDMTGPIALRKKAKKKAKKRGWVSPTITDICLLAAARALRGYPELNAAFMGDEILFYEAIHIGLVVGLETGGMLVPVVRDCDRLNLFRAAAVTRGLRDRAGRGLLSESDLSGGTFSLSNLGMYGVDGFAAVINPPQAGMLALGAIRELPAVYKGAIVPKPMMKATLSVDHRLVDGIVAARFLVDWKGMLEMPDEFTLEPPLEDGK